MKKTCLPSIKSQTRRRVTNSKVSRVPKNDVFCENKENIPEFVPAPVHHMRKVVELKKTRDRDVKPSTGNPYDVPAHKRYFSTRPKPTKPKPDPFIMDDIRTIVDLDPSFYELVEGRPLRQFIDIKRYIRDLRSIALFRTDAAFAKDRVYAIQEKQDNELQEYEKIVKFYEQTKINFVKCIKQSHAESKAAQAKADQMAQDLIAVSDELESSSFEYVKLRNHLCQMGANFETLIYYAKTLNSIAPPWWRKRYDNVNDLANMSYIYIERGDQVGVEQLAPNKSESLSTLDEYEITVVKYRGMPHLYLKSPNQMIEALETFGEQCTNYLKIDAQTSILRKNLINRRAVMRAQFDATVADIVEYVDTFRNNITFYEERAEAYQHAFIRLLMGDFQMLYGSFRNIKLFTCIQFANNQVFGNPEDPKDSAMTLMTELESHYFKLILELDKLNQEVVKMATKISFTKDIHDMHSAHRAKRVLKEFDILHKTLYASFDPPRQRRRPEIIWHKVETKIKKKKKLGAVPSKVLFRVSSEDDI